MKQETIAVLCCVVCSFLMLGGSTACGAVFLPVNQLIPIVIVVIVLIAVITVIKLRPWRDCSGNYEGDGFYRGNYEYTPPPPAQAAPAFQTPNMMPIAQPIAQPTEHYRYQYQYDTNGNGFRYGEVSRPDGSMYFYNYNQGYGQVPRAVCESEERKGIELTVLDDVPGSEPSCQEIQILLPGQTDDCSEEEVCPSQEPTKTTASRPEV